MLEHCSKICSLIYHLVHEHLQQSVLLFRFGGHQLRDEAEHAMADMHNGIVCENLEHLNKPPESLFQVVLKDPHDQVLVGCVGVRQWAILEVPVNVAWVLHR